MKKILAVFGTRPEVIKLAPVVKELRLLPKKMQVKIVSTSQHRQMLDQMLRAFEIKPNYDLNIMRKAQSLTEITSSALSGLEKVMENERPDIVLVQGDTTTAFTAALAAFYQKIPVGHVEAGLRSFQKYAPYPEEVNRVLLSHLASYHFAPTQGAYNNLLREGIAPRDIKVTGNTAIDALYLALSRNNYRPSREVARALHWPGRTILVTAHRRESWGTPLLSICNALRDIVRLFQDVQVVFPVHLNPIVRNIVQSRLGSIKRVLLLKPVEYHAFARLLNSCTIVLTDSGGLQEEAPSLKKPLLIMRQVTERPEAVLANAAKLVGTDRKRIVNEVSKLLTSKKTFDSMLVDRNPFGDGNAAKRIVKFINKL